MICLVITILLVFRIHPSDLNTQVRYSAFGVTHIYSNAWYYLLPVVLFSLTTLVLHSLITIKLFNETNQYIARLFIWVTIAVRSNRGFHWLCRFRTRLDLTTMTDIEIPLGKRTRQYRFFEVLPAIVSYGLILLLVILSLVNPFLAAMYLLAVILTLFIKSITIAGRTIQGYGQLKSPGC